MLGNTHTGAREGRHGPTRALLAAGFTTAVVAGSILATAGTGNAASSSSSGKHPQCESRIQLVQPMTCAYLLR